MFWVVGRGDEGVREGALCAFAILGPCHLEPELCFPQDLGQTKIGLRWPARPRTDICEALGQNSIELK